MRWLWEISLLFIYPGPGAHTAFQMLWLGLNLQAFELKPLEISVAAVACSNQQF
jgi:hypothetical protein